ncbi:MAG: hypothetical protein R8J84_05660 [Mariprofundales bacterium]
MITRLINRLTGERAIFFHYLEWVLNHPRFGLMMMVMIALSFTHNPILAALFFILFSVEIGLRIALMVRKNRTNPYRSSSAQKMDILFLCLDIIGVASLLITVFALPADGADATLARWIRGLYLLRTLRFIRYLDLQSVMSSPTYGMLTSLIIMLSFIATDTLLWALILYFVVELVIRVAVLRSMRFESKQDKVSEWIFWWLDLVATILMVPFFAIIPHGGALRMFRLIRLLRPWLMIARNLRIVMREGQYMQEINLVILITAVLSIGGGTLAQVTLGSFDYSQENGMDANDNTILAPIWFMFRLLTDPGNAVHFPGSTALGLITIVSVIIGVFLFSFFIGIGSNIVSGLMERLRNERLMMSDHTVIIGWSHVTSHIIGQLRQLSEHHFTRLKIALLLPHEQIPDALAKENWINHRVGSISNKEDLDRISSATAREALMMLPDNQTEPDSLAAATFGYLALRRINPEIDITIALAGKAQPRLPEFRHMLEIGWQPNRNNDSTAPSILSEIEFRAASLSNMIVHEDFALILQQLLTPVQTGGSLLQVAEWHGELTCASDGVWWLGDGKRRRQLIPLSAALLLRGVSLLALLDSKQQIIPLYHLPDCSSQNLTISGLLGIAVSNNALCGELRFELRHGVDAAPEPCPPLKLHPLPNEAQNSTSNGSYCGNRLQLLVIGWIGGIPSMLRNLAQYHDQIQLVIIDQLAPGAKENHHRNLQTWLAQQPELLDRITIEITPWDRSDMAMLKPHLKRCDLVLLAAPSGIHSEAHAHITTTLSHLIALCHALPSPPRIVPLIQDHTQAEMLQRDLDRSPHARNTLVMVPDALYGTYIAHHIFHRHTAENNTTRHLHQALQHAVDDLIHNDSNHDQISLHLLQTNDALPHDPAQLFTQLLEHKLLWIGYRLRDEYDIATPAALRWLQRLLPKPQLFASARQRRLILNPFGNPFTRLCWPQHRHQIDALITITTDSNASQQMSQLATREP